MKINSLALAVTLALTAGCSGGHGSAVTPHGATTSHGTVVKRTASLTDFWGYKVDGWQKYPQPVLQVRPGQFDSNLTREISPVIVDTDGKLARGAGGKLTAYYWGEDAAGIFRIGSATSTDNGYTWTNRTVALGPSGVAGSWYSHDVWQPSVIQQAATGQLFMFATGRSDATVATENIGLFSSADGGATWTDRGVQVTMGMFHYEDGRAVTEFGVPRVIKLSDGRYLMTLEGEQTTSSQWRIFAATSTSLSGGWSPLNGGGPILGPQGTGWESTGVANPQVNEVAPGSYVMAYNGYGPQAWKVGFASSTDLVNWYRYPGNPVLRPSGTSGAFDESYVETSFLAKADSYGVAKLYFHGYVPSYRPEVGVATADWREFPHLFPGTGTDPNVYARRSDGALQRVTSQGGGQWAPWEQMGSDWNQFTQIFTGTDGWIYAVRSDGALLRNLYSSNGLYASGTWAGWQQIGSDWSQFTKVFMGSDGWIYAVRSDGALLRNCYNCAGQSQPWAGWTQIGSGWNQFTQVFMGTGSDHFIYAVRSDGVFLKNLYSNGTWQGWVQIGSGWDQFTQVYMGTDGWIYAERSDGHLLKNLLVNGSWQGWVDL